METVLVTGSFGYIGNALTQRLLSEGYEVVGIDNGLKINWLKEENSESAIPFINGFERIKKLKEIGKYYHYNLDISEDVNKLREIFKKYDFSTIVNLAQMPAAPFAQQDLSRASWTIQNNTIGNLNITWMVKDYCPDAHILEIESMGTIDHSISVPIPESKFQFEYKGMKSKPCIFPKQPGSVYHMTKVYNTYTLDAADRWWGLNSTAINQGVVYGCYTPETDESKLFPHFAFDSTFGTVVNRFIIQSLIGKPLTIYGKGDQKRGYLALNDSVQCLMLFIKTPAKGFRYVNQLANTYSINDIAKMIKKINPKTEFEYMESPRVEDTNDFYYNVSTDTLKGLGFKNTRNIEDELKYCYNLIDKENIVYPKENFITWK